MAPLHGDADLYVAHYNQSQIFPKRGNCDKQSQRFGELVDHLEYTRVTVTTTSNNDTVDPNSTAISTVQESLNGTYYVGVYGYSYTTFSLLVTLNRKN